jgi:hypothetical protein
MASCGRLVIGLADRRAKGRQAGCQPAAGCHPAPHSGKPQTVSEVTGSWPIANRPQVNNVNNLPHITSTACLLWYKIVAAREEMKGL